MIKQGDQVGRSGRTIKQDDQTGRSSSDGGEGSAARSVRVNLTDEQALGKRDELVELGYTVVPGVIEPAFVAELRAWSEQVLRQRPVDPRYRYQGSDIAVLTPRYWAKLAGADRIETAKRFSDPIVERILDYPPLLEACRRLGLENLRSSESVVLLSKPPGGPPLYWHQDCVFWNSPRAATPWPTRISLSFYLVDMRRENGCLRVIPGTHRRRIDLHDLLPTAHEAEIQAVTDLTHPMFRNRADAVDVTVHAGDLILADNRLLHGAWPNRTGRRRSLILGWHDVLSFPEPPTWWTGPVPEVVRTAAPATAFEWTRTPSRYLGMD